MNQEVKAQWVAALRSGRYLKDYGDLRSSRGYRATGVLCDLHRRTTGLDWELHPTWVGHKHWSYLGAVTRPPSAVLAWADLEEGACLDLERRHVSFPDLADYIEHNL